MQNVFPANEGNNMIEKCLALYSLTAAAMSAAVAVTPQDDWFGGTAALAVACFSGGFLSGLFSLRQSRKNKEDADIAAINVIIAILGGVSIGFFAALGIHFSEADIFKPIVGIWPPLVGIVLALGGAQFIELIMTGGLLQYLPRRHGGNQNGE